MKTERRRAKETNTVKEEQESFKKLISFAGN
jgi:hypothetical protein